MINSKIEVQFSLHKFIDDIYKEMNKKVLLYSKAMKEIKKGEKTVDSSKKKEPTNFSQTYRQMFEDVKRVVGELKETDEDGWIHYKYYVRDIQDVTVIVEELYSGKLIGFPLSFNGDTPVIDFELWVMGLGLLGGVLEPVAAIVGGVCQAGRIIRSQVVVDGFPGDTTP